MTYLEIVQAVLSDLFGESKRADAKNWVNTAAGRLWGADNWIFKTGTDTCGTTAGVRALASPPADMLTPIELLNSNADVLIPMTDVREFFDIYGDNNSGTPEAWALLGGDIIVGPIPIATDAAYTLVYRKAFTLMSADGDVPGLPDAVHLAIVDGAKAIGARLNHIPTWRDMQDEFDRTILEMRDNYLLAIPTSGEQQRAFRP